LQIGLKDKNKNSDTHFKGIVFQQISIT